jgi:DNA invertase Pin-like site-specific DNA recombinase
MASITTAAGAIAVRCFGAKGADIPGMLPHLDCHTDSEVRALTAKGYRLAGLKPQRIARILSISRSQVYADLKAARSDP